MATGDVTQALQLAFDKLGALAQQYGPKALDLAAQVKQTDAIGSLIFTGALAVFTVVWLVALVWAWRRIIRDQIDYGPEVLAGFASVFWLVPFIAVVVRTTDIWVWVALTNPKLALAHDVLSALADKAAS